jgi:hypothetical protein
MITLQDRLTGHPWKDPGQIAAERGAAAAARLAPQKRIYSAVQPEYTAAEILRRRLGDDITASERVAYEQIRAIFEHVAHGYFGPVIAEHIGIDLGAD